MGLAGFLAGSLFTPEQAKIARRYVTNAAGPYALYAGLGFAAGQANVRGRDPGTSVIRELDYAMPLPTMEPFLDTLEFLQNPGWDTAPRGVLPGFAWELHEGAKSAKKLPSERRISTGELRLRRPKREK